MFDPILITWQIVTLQCCFYAVFVVLVALSSVFFGSPMTLDLLFSPNNLSGTSNVWFLVSWTYFVSGFVGYVSMIMSLDVF